MSLRTATRALLAPTRTASTSALALRGVAAARGVASSSSSSSAVLRTRSWPQPASLSTRPISLFPPRCVASTTVSKHSLHTTSANLDSSSSSKPNERTSESSAEEDPDSPPPKATLRERLKFLTRRYGWWALGVYLAASTVDFSLTFLAIHLLGADHIRSLESSLRKSIGLEQRDQAEGEEERETKSKNGTSTIWTEAVLAYTIHKTLLLPVRVAFTAAVTPSFVKWLVRMGWAKANHVVKAAVGRKAADKAIQDVVKRNAPNAAKHS